MKRKHRKGSASVAVFVIVLLVAVAMGGFLVVSGKLGKINRVSSLNTDAGTNTGEEFERDTSEADTLQAQDVDFNADNISVMKDDDVKNILLIGQDAREGEGRQRSDSMILCSINTKTKKIVLTSLMRDMYVQIPGYSSNKLNAAYCFGGMELLDQVIENNFGITIDGNVAVDFFVFMDAMSVVGNLDIELTAEEAEYINSGGWVEMGSPNDGWNLKAGVNSMTPAQYLAFARIRYVGNSDYERTDRQRRDLTAAFDKVKDKGLTDLLTMANQMFPYLTTDLTNTEILSYVKTVFVDGITETESRRIPVDGYFSEEIIDGMSVLVPDLTMNSQYLQNYIYGTPVDESLAGSTDEHTVTDTTGGTDSSGTDTGSGYDSSGYDSTGAYDSTYTQNYDTGGYDGTYDSGTDYGYGDYGGTDTGSGYQDNTYGYQDSGTGTENSYGTGDYADPGAADGTYGQ